MAHCTLLAQELDAKSHIAAKLVDVEIELGSAQANITVTIT